MYRNHSVNIDVPAMKKFFKANNVVLADLSKAMGFSHAWANSFLKAGRMTQPSYKLLCSTLSVPEGTFIKEEPEVIIAAIPVEEQANGYSLSLDVSPDKVRMGIMFNGCELDSAFARIRGDNELALMEAISYAALRLYRNAEQRDIAATA